MNTPIYYLHISAKNVFSRPTRYNVENQNYMITCEIEIRRLDIISFMRMKIDTVPVAGIFNYA